MQVFPEITLHIVPDAGHSSREPGIAKLLVEVCGLDCVFEVHIHFFSLLYIGNGFFCEFVIIIL